MSKVKEKAPVGKQLKEKVQTAPKELLRRGLSDGTQRLRGQFRDTTQRDQRDGYGGDQIEDTAWAGGRWAKRGIQKLLKQKKDGGAKGADRSTPRYPEPPTEPPSWDNPVPPDLPESPAPQGGTEHVRIKTREAVARSGPADVSRGPLIKSDFKEAQKSSGPKIKTRDSVLQPHLDAVTPTSETPAPFELPTVEKGPERVRIKTIESVPQSGSAVRPQFENRQIKQRSSFFRSRSASPTQTADTPGSFEPLAPKERPKRVQIKTRTPAMDQHSSTVIPDKKPVELPSQARRDFRAQDGVSGIFNRAKGSLVGRPPVSDEIPSTVPSSTHQYKRPIIKAKDTHVHQEVLSSLEQPSQVFDHGRKLFQRKQTRKLAEKRNRGQQSSTEIPSISQAGLDKPSVQRSPFGNRSIQSREASDLPISRAKSSVKGESMPGEKRAMNAVRPDKAVRSGSKAAERITGKSVKTAERTSRQMIKSANRGAKVVERTAKAVPRAHRRAVQAVRATKKVSATTSRGVAKASKAALRATVRAARMLAAALSAAGSVVTAVVLVICLVGMLASSPFGIFFADSSSPGTASPSTAVLQLNNEFSDYLSVLQAGGNYDRVEIIGQPPDWSDVFAVFAARTAGAANGVDVVMLDTARLDLLRAVFWDMTKVTTAEEDIDHPAVGDTPAWTETVLTITITARTPDDMRVLYSFTDAQNQALDALLANGGMLASLSGDLTITSQDAKALLASLPSDLSPERRAVVETACRLVGKVNYFWGGKSRVLGWDERWGQIKKVTAAGSSTSGTYLPFGLDCSGFVDWVFYNVSGGSYIIGHGGGARSQHTYCTAITWEQAIPGDLVFYPGDSHVGIVGGRDESGNLLIIHCTYSRNNVVITGKSGFTAIARPNYYSE